MNPKHPTPLPASPGISLVDIYYILFRHKWLIAILSIIAIGAAITVRFTWNVPYESEAELLIKYIKDATPVQENPGDAHISKLDSRGENILNTEITILTSMDVAQQVAQEIGPVKIIGKVNGETNANVLQAQAAYVVRAGLVIPPELVRSDVIRLTFSHPDFEMVKPILEKIIAVYEAKHKAVHQPDDNENMTKSRDEIEGNLSEVNKRIRELRTSTGLISIDDSKKRYNDELSRTQASLSDVQSEQAGCQERIRQLQKLMPAAFQAAASTNAMVTTNQPKPVPPDKAAEYQRICAQLNTDQAEEHRLLGTYKPDSDMVKTQHAQVAKTEADKKQMEDAYPGLIALRPAEARSVTAAAGPDPKDRLNEEIIKFDDLAGKIKYLTNQLAQIQSFGATIIAQEGPLTKLEKEKANLESKLETYSRRIADSQIDAAVGPGNSNINEIEEPTAPARDLTKLNKMVMGIMFGGLILAFGLPFLIELYLDRSLKHPVDVQTKLGLPFFISIPQMNGNGNGKVRAVKNAKKIALLPGKTGEATEPAMAVQPAGSQSNGSLTLWDDRHSLRPFYETLRDRLMTYFEMINLTHKPKLVAVTSCGEGAGVTSTAAGLASSLSETGDGNVLLVNMNVRDGEAHHFYKGKLTCDLDQVLEKETREDALVQGNLYVAKEQENDDKLPRILPKRFSHLLPKMKASDFDYIIFDMPPVSQISITPRLARFMDMVLLVVESGKTDRDAAKRAADLLSESKTNIGVVLNKNRSYLPRRLHHDI